MIACNRRNNNCRTWTVLEKLTVDNLLEENGCRVKLSSKIIKGKLTTKMYIEIGHSHAVRRPFLVTIAPTVLLKLIGNVIYLPYPVIEIPIICADCSIGILKSVLHFEGIMI